MKHLPIPNTPVRLPAHAETRGRGRQGCMHAPQQTAARCSAVLLLVRRGGTRLLQRSYCTWWEQDFREGSYRAVCFGFFPFPPLRALSR